MVGWFRFFVFDCNQAHLPTIITILWRLLPWEQWLQDTIWCMDQTLSLLNWFHAVSLFYSTLSCENIEERE